MSLDHLQSTLIYVIFLDPYSGSAEADAVWGHKKIETFGDWFSKVTSRSSWARPSIFYSTFFFLFSFQGLLLLTFPLVLHGQMFLVHCSVLLFNQTLWTGQTRFSWGVLIRRRSNSSRSWDRMTPFPLWKWKLEEINSILRKTLIWNYFLI